MRFYLEFESDKRGTVGSLCELVAEAHRFDSLARMLEVRAPSLRDGYAIAEYTDNTTSKGNHLCAVSLTCYNHSDLVLWTYCKTSFGRGVVYVFSEAFQPWDFPGAVFVRYNIAPQLVWTNDGLASVAARLSRGLHNHRTSQLNVFFPQLSCVASYELEINSCFVATLLGMDFIYDSEKGIRKVCVGEGLDYAEVSRKEEPTSFRQIVLNGISDNRSGKRTQYIEVEVDVVWKDRLLRGVVTIPNGHYDKIAVFLAGSGLHDADGKWFDLDIPYDEWCRSIALSSSIAVLRFSRYDFHDGEALQQYASTDFEGLVSQVSTWIGKLKQDHRFERCKIGIIGHSLGALIALDACRRDLGVDWIVLLAAPGRNLSEVLWAQAKLAGANAPHVNDYIMSKHQLIQDIVAGKAEIDMLTSEIDRQYISNRIILYRDMFSIDPKYLAEKCKCKKVMVAWGREDSQVFIEDYEILCSSFGPDVHLVKVEADKRGHLFTAIASAPADADASRDLSVGSIFVAECVRSFLISFASDPS